MRIVVEQYPYEETALKLALKGFDHLPPANDGVVRVDYVGYCFLPEVNDCVFFLPKVVLQRRKKDDNGEDFQPSQDEDENKEKTEKEIKETIYKYDWVFGVHKPEDILCVEDALNEKFIDEDEHKFLYELSVWIYSAVREFKMLNPKSEIVSCESVSLVDISQNRVENTFIDIMLSLQRFNEENQDFFMFTIKNIHSGFNKINWRKTIATKQPVIQDGTPIYMNPVNKKKQINFDEELFIIFFSILNYMLERYNFPVKINFNYELITGELFEHYIDGYGEIRLKQIKYKYFSDKALKLWTLCHAFFERTSRISSSNSTEDYLLAKSFEIVFESIIDNLLGQPELPKKLKDQKDGKILDHLFLYNDLVHRPIQDKNQIYYIGDSKYYKIGAAVGENSIYKQYTYAKNIIQYDFDLFFDGKRKKDELLYLDPLTEGYNITPNFFLSADLSTDQEGKINFSFDEDGLKKHTDNKGKDVVHLNRHFENRLFDRDTLWLSHYDINFLYILALYARSNDAEKSIFRDKARKEFREAIIGVLNDNYDFSILLPKANRENALEVAVNDHYLSLRGKIYRPKDVDYVLLALDKKDEKNNELVQEVEQDFIQVPISLDEEGLQSKIDDKLREKKLFSIYRNETFVEKLLVAEPPYNIEKVHDVIESSKREKKSIEKEYKPEELPLSKALETEFVLIGYLNDELLEPIKKTRLYYVRTGSRRGAIKPEDIVKPCKYLFLHNKYSSLLFRLTSNPPHFMYGKELISRGLPAGEPDEIYLTYELASPQLVSLEGIDLSKANLEDIGARGAAAVVRTINQLFPSNRKTKKHYRKKKNNV